MPVHIKACRAAAIEKMNQCRVAQTEQRLLQSDGVVHAQSACLLFGDRRSEFVMRHC